MDNKSALLPNIYDYLSTYTKEKVIPENLQYVIEKICDETGLSIETANEIVSVFFGEIKRSVLAGRIVTIRKFGKLFISSPKTSKNDKRIFLKFEPSPFLVKRLNQDD